MGRKPGLPIVAHDDNGWPITTDDLLRESDVPFACGRPFRLVPLGDFEGDEDNREQPQPIEAVRARCILSLMQ